ncbi:hypothetical protein Pelo_18453 [Pelomyxa schiedti]|nr:hypothetical protein Pelo_18453 [Pelomyxa schiedti]
MEVALNVDGRDHTPATAQTSSSPIIITFTFAVPGDHAHLWKRYRRGRCQIEYGPRQEMYHNWHVHRLKLQSNTEWHVITRRDKTKLQVYNEFALVSQKLVKLILEWSVGGEILPAHWEW